MISYNGRTSKAARSVDILDCCRAANLMYSIWWGGERGDGKIDAIFKVFLNLTYVEMDGCHLHPGMQHGV